MLERFFPDEWIGSAYGYDYAAARAEGYRAVLFDIDNTLVLPDAPADHRAKELFAALRGMGFTVCLISNNNEKRVSSFAAEVGSEYLHKAGKPARKGYLRAMRLCGSSPETTLFIGDQLFTDVWGARRCGIRSILTLPIEPKGEEIQIVLKRLLERVVLRAYRKAGHREPERPGEDGGNSEP